jgi:N-acyl-phosphatidylethanolamine-hydrolysing phospholipase D
MMSAMQIWMRTTTLIVLVLACLQVAAANSASHHRDGHFQNNYIEFEPKGLNRLLQWKWQAMLSGFPPQPTQPTARVAPELDFIHANARAGAAMQPSATWIGHATALVQMGGLNLLTDPIFSERASPLEGLGPKRAQPPGLALAQLPHIDLVLISHNHYDHLDAASVRALAAQSAGSPLFIVPLGLKAWMADEGIDNVVELDWWQSHRIGAVEVVMTPVQHWSGRSLTDRMQTLWCGYAVFAPDLHLYFSGDTGYSPDFIDTRERFKDRQTPAQGGGFDLALIAIGAYEPRWFMKDQHVDPAEAVQVHRDLRAKRSIGVHWGTFELTDEALDEPPRALAKARRQAALSEAEFGVLPIGGTLRLQPRDAASTATAASDSAAPATRSPAAALR